jgi:hypothetical protein
MTMSINPSLWSTGLEQIVKSTIGEAFKAKENVNMIDEIKQEITWYDQHDKMKDGEKGDKYGYDNKGMTGDKKY